MPIYANGGSVLAAGQFIAGSPNCCCGSCPDCPPDHVILTLSDVNLCEGCINTTDEGLGLIMAVGDVNGTYVIPFLASVGKTCCYQNFTEPTLFSFDLYSGPGCGEFFGTLDSALDLRVGRNGADCKWFVTVALRAVVPDEMRVFQGNPQLSFADPFSNAAICGPGAIFSNQCNVRESEITVGHGGIAVLSL